MPAVETTNSEANSEKLSVRSLILTEIDTLKHTMEQHISEKPENLGLPSSISEKMEAFKEKLNEIEKAAKRLRKPEKLNKIRREVILCKIRISGSLHSWAKTEEPAHAPLSDLTVDIDVARARLRTILEAKRSLETGEKPGDPDLSENQILDKQINAFLLALIYGLHFTVSQDLYVKRNPEFLQKNFIEGGGYTKKSVFTLLKTRAKILKSAKHMTEYRLKAELVATFDHINEIIIPEIEKKRQTRKLKALALKELLRRKRIDVNALFN